MRENIEKLGETWKKWGKTWKNDGKNVGRNWENGENVIEKLEK